MTDASQAQLKVKGAVSMEWLYVGYIRTNAFLKAIGMFDPEHIMQVDLARDVQRETKREAFKDVIYRDRKVVESFGVAWEAEKHGGSFPVFPVDKVKQGITKGGLGDFIVRSIQHRFTSKKLALYLNEEIRTRALDKGKDIKDVVFLPEHCEFYASYSNNFSDDLKALPYVKPLNQHEIDLYKFKLACLDLVELKTERSVKYGEKEHIPVRDDIQIIRYVLNALDWDGWPAEKRIVELPGATVVPKPVAIRQYHITASKGWQLAGEKEVE
jgi:hypothetical protein